MSRSVAEFEKAFSACLQTPQVFAFHEAQVAMYAIFKALGVTRGTEVIVPGYTSIGVVKPVKYLGGVPVYVDINPQTYTMAPEGIEAAITDRTRLIVAQHTYGYPAEMEAIQAVALCRNIPVVEDARMAVGSTYKGHACGTMGHAACWSFGWDVPYAGDWGGVAGTAIALAAWRMGEHRDRDAVAPRSRKEMALAVTSALRRLLARPRLTPAIRRLAHWLSRVCGRGDDHHDEGTVSEFPPADFFMKMSPRQVEEGLRTLARLEATLCHRRELKRLYDHLLAERDWPRTPLPPDLDPALVHYPVRVANKALALAEASRRFLELGSGFDRPVHGAEGSLHLYNYPDGACPEAERATREVVTLPTHRRMTEKLARKCVDLVCDIGPAKAPRDETVRCPRQMEDIEVPHGISINLVAPDASATDLPADLSDRLERSTERLLEAFAAVDVHATFFVPGAVAEKAAHLVRRIAAAGHEVQSHGFRHVEVFKTGRAGFRKDLLRSKALLEDLIGEEVYGYRAPRFSLGERTPWAFDVLAETGHRYDSSILPVKTARGGAAGCRPEPRLVETGAGRHIVEAPIACFHWLDRQWLLSGGDSLRLWPYWVLRKAMNQLERLGRPAVLHICPCDYELPEVQAAADTPSLATRLYTGLGRKGAPKKIDRLLAEFAFGPLRAVLEPLLADPALHAETAVAAAPS
jgi:polysaccharide deacetylase family protein (PEP-CTERM system associated)